MKSYDINCGPLYLKQFKMPEFKIEDKRFNVDDLENLYKYIKQESGMKGNNDLVDEKTFTNSILLAFRQGKIP